MPSSQKLALKFKANFWDEGNSRWRYIMYKGSKIDTCSIPSVQTLQNLFQFLQFGTDSKLERFIWGSIKLSSFIFRLGIIHER